MTVPHLLVAATFLPLLGASAGLTARWWRPRKDDRAAGFVACACIWGAFALSVAAAVRWDGGALAGTWYELLALPGVTLELGHHVDSLTLTMFALVTLVAGCVCVFALGYLSDELTEEHRDHALEEELVRPGPLSPLLRVPLPVRHGDAAAGDRGEPVPRLLAGGNWSGRAAIC